ncbi:MAG: MazG family protein [Actinobacteria bacterium]|jgi:XTP/dITP diphosphohydrolase|nr:MazG family protein [Actinomycetota bacterium]NBO51238.1 MazG family protein [Actinomycetota bacterium]NBQ59591.1 MazG family protein [Actinomycetota bacterium]NBY82390.1 MazG family protein [Actinomycetota bacterium]NCA25538.1 MazG family protein [Actinomycetota bacterium]
MGSELLRLREVMDKLRSPGGCPWDAEQDHASLLKYLLEESYEFIEAVENNDKADMKEELGDLLLQVYFHSRMAEEDIDSPFDIEDVAKGVADKLIRRHPHVFGETKVGSSEEVLENWESQKAAEKGRTSLIDGVPLAQPALSLATKIIYRINKLDAQLPISKSVSISPEITEDQFGELLLGLIAQAVEKGIDPEAALRSAAKSLIERIKIHESR